MTKQIRNEFENKFKQLIEIPNFIFPAFSEEDDEYIIDEHYYIEILEYLQWGWMMWKASRESIVIELPKNDKYTLTKGTAELIINDCKKAIESAGIQVKHD